MKLKAAIIGCGKRSPNFAQSCVDAGDVTMVGFADPVAGAADKLVEQFGGKAFTDVAKMLAATKPHFVCLVTRPSVRLEPITACAKAGVKAMLSEKPMCTSWAQAKAIHKAAADAGMALSFCHQRRVDPQFLMARQMLADGAIGKLKHIVAHCDNFYDWGTHWFDMMHYFNDQTPAAWVMAQVQLDDPKFVFDQPMDRCGVSVVKFANDIVGTLHTGAAQAEGCRVRLIGETGSLCVGDGPLLELYNDKGVARPTIDETAVKAIPAGVKHAIDSFRRGTTSLLDSANALMATELIFATYLSAMRGEKIALPLDIADLSLAEVFNTAKQQDGRA